MIYFWTRLIIILVSKGIRPHWNLNKDISMQFRVRIMDCDGFQIMSGFQYPMYMDIVRWAHITNAGFLKLAVKNKWAPVVRSQKIFYIRPLRLWSTFSVNVSIVGWDENWFYHQHVFEQKNSIKAIGFTKAGIWKKRELISVKEVLDDPRILFKEKLPPILITQLFANDNEVQNYVTNSIVSA